MLPSGSSSWALALLLSSGVVAQGPKDVQKAISPAYELFQAEMPIPKLAKPKMQITNPKTNMPIDYYEMEIKPLTKRIFPGANMVDANLVGYDGETPGPTFIVPRGQETVIRFKNSHTADNSVHLHGSYSRAPWDGWADDVTKPGEYKDYYYPNSQSARMLWYHDHAVDHTAENAYFGQAGAYIITDSAEDALNLPRGYGECDIPIILTSKQYKANGDIDFPKAEATSLYGDVIHVNGQPWPFFKVQARKYRLRFLDASVSRTFSLSFDADGQKVDFQVIASDAGLFEHPVKTNALNVSIAERYEAVVDFAPYAGKSITLRNERKVGADLDYPNTDKVMRFDVGSDKVEDPSQVPANLRTVPFPAPKDGKPAHAWNLGRGGPGGKWAIGDATWHDTSKRILANVPRGTVEVWEFTGPMASWTHPMHVHMVDFRVKSRTGSQSGARGKVEEYEAAGLKDVVWVGRGETVQVEAHYAPWDGVYMFHCHNLIHEDHEMMAAFNISSLPDLGYDETKFLDPMEDRWRAKKVSEEAYTPEAITKTVQEMASLQPYNNVETVKKLLEEYWKGKGAVPKVKARLVSRRFTS